MLKITRHEINSTNSILIAMKSKYLLTIAVFVSLFIPICAQPSEELDRKLNKIHQESKFPGFAVAIVKPNAVVFSAGYGFADKIKKTPYTISTIQPIGSVSKTFIALAAIKSIELGYFNLETDINSLLPFRVVNPNSPHGIVRVKHLVTHTSSLLDDEMTYLQTYNVGIKPKMELGDFLKEYYTPNGRFYKLSNFAKSEVGTNYSYSNIGSALMAYIIEVKSQMNFAAFTDKHIFEPLKMTKTDWFYRTENEDLYAKLYQINKRDSPLYDSLLNSDNSLKSYSCVTYPDGSLKTSVADLTKYLQAMMTGYFEDKDLEIISKSGYQALFAKQFSESNMPANMDAKEPNRAVFWSYTRKGEIRHTGSDPGIFSFVSFNPQTKLGRIMTINADLEGEDNAQTVKDFMKIIAALDEFENKTK